MVPRFFIQMDGTIMSSRVERGGVDVQSYGKMECAPYMHAQRTAHLHFPKGRGCPNYMRSLQNTEQNRDSVQVRMANQPVKDLWVALASGLPLEPLASLAWPEHNEFWLKFGAQLRQLQFLEFPKLLTKLCFQYSNTRILAQYFWLSFWEP